MLGLKRGAVALYLHEKAWEAEAQETMARLRQILGPVDVEENGLLRRPVSLLHRTRSKKRSISKSSIFGMKLKFTKRTKCNTDRVYIDYAK